MPASWPDLPRAEDIERGQNGQHGRDAEHRRDALGEQRAEQAPERAGTLNLTEALLRRSRIEALAGDQPEPGAEHRTKPRHVQVDQHDGGPGRPRVSAHSTSNRKALAPNNAGTNCDGRRFATMLAVVATSRIDTAEVATTMAGSVVTSSSAR